MNQCTDILHDFRDINTQRNDVCNVAIIGHINLKVEEQSLERYKYVDSYDSGIHFDLYRLYIAKDNLLNQAIQV